MNSRNFTLKVRRFKGGRIIPDDRHESGGIDVDQVVMFRHIAPSGECDELMFDSFINLAEAHGWNIKISNEF